MNTIEKLISLAKKLDSLCDYDLSDMKKFNKKIEELGKSFSQSWIGYHSKVYYKNFEVPPQGARFSQEWGLKDVFGDGTIGEWHEFSEEDVGVALNIRAEKSPLSSANKKKSFEAKEVFEEIKMGCLSTIHSDLVHEKDEFLKKAIEKIEKSQIYTGSDYVKTVKPVGSFISRDMEAMTKGLMVPPHIAIYAEVFEIMGPYLSAFELRKSIRFLVSHLESLENRVVKSKTQGTHIFIGHGHSPLWREFKDFVKDRLNLKWDEFNRIPVAGRTNIVRLSEMLNQAKFAFLILTAEDEQKDGSYNARLNVIHEVGLFQGKLGFEKAIVLVEEGCEQFSNINGLGQIRFPKGNISAIFEEVRRTLEHEEIIN